MNRKIFNHDFVYFIQGEYTKRIKIGKTNCPIEDRLHKLQSNSPDNLILLGVCFGYKYSESSLHKMFDQYRLHAEWFSDAKIILNFIDKNCFKDIKAAYYAYQEIENGRISYYEALALGENELCKYADQEFLNIVGKFIVW